MQDKVVEEVELVSTHCRHPECIYRSQIDGGRIPICFYAAMAGEPRRCKISECDKYKDGRKVRPKMRIDYTIEWECDLYDDEDADSIWRGYW